MDLRFSVAVDLKNVLVAPLQIKEVKNAEDSVHSSNPSSHMLEMFLDRADGQGFSGGFRSR